ncbi:MAG: ABC transporter substrate-binding protein, partial [Planctomycetota bacterium]
AGYVGTPTSKVAVPIVADYEVPLVGLFTGAGFLRDPEQPWFPWVINLRASYDEETEALVERLTSDLGVQRIAVFYQDDSFGRVGLEGTIAALERRDMSLVGSGTYTRNTVAVKSGLVDIAEARPEAVIMVGAYQPLAAFVQAARETDLDAVFCTISFVGTENLIDALGPAAEGLVISQVVPSPTRSELPVAQAFRRALAAHDPGAEPTYVAFEGYLNGSLLVSGLEAAGAEPTRAGLMQAYQDMGDLELGGLSMSLAPEDHQGMDTVYITRVDEGVAVPVERLTP